MLGSCRIKDTRHGNYGSDGQQNQSDQSVFGDDTGIRTHRPYGVCIHASRESHRSTSIHAQAIQQSFRMLRADPERVPAHLPADGRPVPARRPCDVGLAPALVPHQHDLLALRQCRMCVPAHASSDVWLSVASTIVSVTHGPLPFPAVALEMKIHVSKWRSYSDTLRDSTPIPSCSNFKRF